MEWRPIGEARIWSNVLLWGPDIVHPVVGYVSEYKYTHERYGWAGGEYADVAFTHWMPLPPPPTGEDG